MIRVSIRWMLVRDRPEVLAIEAASFATPWDEGDFIRALRDRNVVGFVAESDGVVVGLVVYHMGRASITIVNLAVHPGYRRRGVGRQLVARLAGKLSSYRRTHLDVTVRERNLRAQLFYSACGLRAVQSLRGHYPDTGEDGIGFLLDYGTVVAGTIAHARHA